MKTTLSVALFCASLAFAPAQIYVAHLDGAQDGGGARQGIGDVSLTLSGLTLSLSGSYSGLSAPSTATHIHGASGPYPATAGVRYDLGALGIATIGATSGTYSGSLTLADIGAYTTGQQISDLNNGLWYINVHDATFPGGEIRGQILVIPEPATCGLLGLGLAGLIWHRCRRRPTRG